MNLAHGQAKRKREIQHVLFNQGETGPTIDVRKEIVDPFTHHSRLQLRLW